MFKTEYPQFKKHPRTKKLFWKTFNELAEREENNKHVKQFKSYVESECNRIGLKIRHVGPGLMIRYIKEYAKENNIKKSYIRDLIAPGMILANVDSACGWLYDSKTGCYLF